MKTLLDFAIDRDALTRRDTSNLTNEDPAMLSHLFFVMPVTLIVGNVAILDSGQLPLINIAFDSLYTVRSLPRLKLERMILPPGGGLEFRLEGADATVVNLHNNATGQSPYLELLQAWENFSYRVRRFLLDEFPELVQHPQLGEWFLSEAVSDESGRADF